MKIKPGRIALDRHDDYSNLLCPGCGNDRLHHSAVVSYHRSEDAEKIARTVTDVNGSTTTEVVPNDRSGNPSSHRHGLAVRFDRGNCGSTFDLTIAQHKGSTELAWRESSVARMSS